MNEEFNGIADKLLEYKCKAIGQHNKKFFLRIF